MININELCNQENRHKMNISGILVVVAPEQVNSTVETLAALQGIDVHHIDQPSGRIIITQEAEAIHDEIDGLKRIRALPGKCDKYSRRARA
jgi:nitrate reductase NapD